MVRLAQSVIPNILTLILNHEIIAIFGSDVNGVLSTAAQVINFLALFEAGFTLSTTVALYGPYLEKDTETINSILHSAKVLYQKIGLIISFIGIIISVVVPFLISSSLSKQLISSIFLISVLNISLTFMVSMKYGIMFSVSQQEYKLNLVSLIFQSLSQFLCIVLLRKTSSIVVVRLVWYLIPFLALPLISFLFRKNFPGVGFKSNHPSKLGLAGAKDVFAQKIAVLVTNNTDLVIISIFLGTQFSSVYSVYYFVYAGLKQVLFSFVLAPFNAFGQLFAGNQLDTLRASYKTYQFICIMLISIILTTGNVLIIPFVKLYTSGVNDVNYIDLSFALLFSVAAFMELVSNIMGVVVNSIGFFKKMKPIVLWGALGNVMCSLVLVQFLGLRGIAIGTILSYLFMNGLIGAVLYRDALKTASGYFLKYLIVNIGFSIILLYIALRLTMIIDSYLAFCLYGMFAVIIVSILFILLNLFSDPKEMRNVSGRIRTLFVHR